MGWVQLCSDIFFPTSIGSTFVNWSLVSISSNATLLPLGIYAAVTNFSWSLCRNLKILYNQCMEVWIHFMQHSIHLLTHMGPETFQIGPLLCHAQWMLEKAIGNLSQEIRQDHDQFANLTQQAVIWAQVNSLCTLYPQIKFKVGGNAGAPHSTGSHNFKGGFVFLPWCKEFPLPLAIDKLVALKNYWWEQGWLNMDSWPNTVYRWAKLHLPNRQTAWSVGTNPASIWSFNRHLA